MKHIIIGTAGHIDHGKTTLIRALTGRNTDRLKEEQKRGISIELGFTYFDLPSGQRAGIIDVPGHEKFIKNMLAGIIGIDIVILVVAADEGIMPQTHEHLQILDLLGIQKGFVAITKTDLVEDEWIELVEEEIKEEIEGSFLEGKPILKYSSKEEDSLKDIIELLEVYSEDIEARNLDEIFRLPVDRSFVISGFGTIVTGTLLSGSLKIGDEVQIFPGGNKARVRTVQVHDQDAETAYAGQRVAINLAGIKKDQVDRGSIIAPVDSMKDTMMLDVKLKLLKSIDKSIKNRTRVRLYIGTKEVLCRVILLDREEMLPGEEAYAQLRLEEEIVANWKDKFIIRFYSPMFTIGGGEVLDPNPEKKKRFEEDTIDQLKIKEKGSPKDLIENIILESKLEFPSIKELSLKTSMLEEGLKENILELIEEDKVLKFDLTNDSHVIHRKNFKKVKKAIIDELEEFHKNYPLRVGIAKEEFKSKFLKDVKSRIYELFIERLIKEESIQLKEQYIQLVDFKIEYSKEQKEIKENIERIMKENAFIPIKKDEIKDKIKSKEKEVIEVFNSMVNSGDIVKLNEEIFLIKEDYERALKLLKDFLNENTSISLGEYRDLIDSNRRTSIAILEYFDNKKITKRVDDKRELYN
jgi:selenocysteine-specific elongation factor